ncbi:MAG: haloacid dehalogenase-like hydrolase [Clostridia bacterium]|nr:haloacid dehalogenase-like hydrolase [Clostridia bacterium]
MKTKLLSGVALLLSLALILSAMPGLAFAEEYEDAFTQWNEEAPALNALIDYVDAVTDPSSPDFIPEADRIATFDMDGTLIGELFPTYLEVILLTERILADPSYQPDEEMLAFGRMTRDHALDKSFPDDYDYEFSYHQAKAFAGMTLTEYADFITRFLVHEADGFEGMTYASAYYLPMEEVVDYLRDNGFKCYVVSGSDRFIVRTFMEGAFDIPAENIIGSDTALAARNQGDTDGAEYVFTGDDELVRTDRLLVKDLKTNKVVQIAQEIGRQPVLSFGNSSGDVSMNNYALLNNRYRSAAFMLVADDDVRDYGNSAKHDELTQKWQGMGYNVISMRDDWKTIYGEDVVKTGEFHWLSDYADKPDEASVSSEYTLEQVVVLSRHNLRAPLSSNGSVPSELTPHQWIEWSAGSSELTLKGGMEETSMGQYFRKWLDQEGLIPENYVPKEGEVRFSARDKQRCRATARYFAAGMLPLADIEVEHPGDAKGAEDFMEPVLHFYSDDYAADATAQVAAMGGDTGFDGLAQQNRDVIKLIMDTVDMQDSEIYQSGKYGDLLADSFGYSMKGADTEPDIEGAVKPAYQVADALLLQYYEEPDAVKAAFGHELKDEDWAEIGAFMTTCLKMKHGAPLVAANITNPLLRELKTELENENRKFTFFCAHDCTVLGTLSALGAEPYTLPESIETMTPIGVKLMLERWRDGEGQAWYRVYLLYRSTEQIRSGEMLTLDNPPLTYDLRFEGVETNADGLISEADLFGLFDRSIDVLDELENTYALENAA